MIVPERFGSATSRGGTKRSFATNVRLLPHARAHDGVPAYDDRALPSGHLDPARLAVLADALEDTDEQILGHLRGPGPHVRGCAAVDAVLGKR